MAVSMSGSLFIQHVVRHFTVTCQNRLSRELVTRAVHAPYLWILDKNAAMSAHHVSNDALMWSNDGMLLLLNAVGQMALLVVTAGVVMVAAAVGGVDRSRCGWFDGIAGDAYNPAADSQSGGHAP